ncbi:MAG: hypothetical protein Q9179_005599 [Wetmoreana sp. 5 TL-2023]
MAHSQFDKSLRYVTLDVFTEERFRGNPLAIVESSSEVGQDVKQRIAREFNLSETVFLHPPSDGGFDRTCDIFTTTEELPFAGHPTIGTLVYLGSQDEAADGGTQSIVLRTKAGPINAKFHRDTEVAEASIPHSIRIHQKSVPWQTVLDAQPSLDRLPAESKQPCRLVSIVKGMTFVLIHLPHVEDLLSLTVGGPRLDPGTIKWDEGWASFTAPYYYVITSDDENATPLHIRTRMIDQSFGEDPATGSAASALSSYLALALYMRTAGRTTHLFSIEQGTEMGRRSKIGVNVTLDDSGKSVKEVLLSGSAVPVSQGTISYE